MDTAMLTISHATGTARQFRSVSVPVATPSPHAAASDCLLPALRDTMPPGDAQGQCPLVQLPSQQSSALLHVAVPGTQHVPLQNTPSQQVATDSHAVYAAPETQ